MKYVFKINHLLLKNNHFVNRKDDLKSFIHCSCHVYANNDTHTNIKVLHKDYL